MRDVLDAIERHSEFLILGHEDPDGDCLGSQLALSSLLKRMGKECFLISHGPYRKPGAVEWAHRFTDKLPRPERLDEGTTALVLLDCSSLNRTGLDLTPYRHFPLIVIDHHASASDEGNYSYIDPQSPSTTLLVQDIIEASGLTMSGDEADYIFFGFCTDTDYFRHLEEHHKGVFQKLDRLMDKGISPPDVQKRISSGRSIKMIRHMGRVLERVEPYFGGRLIFTWVLQDDFKDMDDSERSFSAPYKDLQSIQGSQVVAVAKESKEGELSVSFRSSCEIDVSAIAQRFGGGGHVKASGCTFTGTIDDFRKTMKEIFTPIFAGE